MRKSELTRDITRLLWEVVIMSMNINGFGAGSNYSYKNTDTKSKQYKAAAKDHLAAFMEKTKNLFAKTLRGNL